MIGVLGGMCAGSAYTFVRYLGTKEAPNTIVFYFSLFSTVITFPLMLIYYEPMKLLQLVYLILAGIFASLGQFAITRAYKYAPAREISIFDYTNIIFSALISLFLFGILPDYLSVIGYIIIFMSSLYMIKGNKVADNQ
jgi:drug/metabolite transporter (DMT)-like permease